MAHGGARKGAGRPKGLQNKINAQARKKALEGGISPLEYMLRVMRNPKADGKRRDAMAAAAAPYVHAKRASIQHSGSIGTVDLTNATEDQLAALEALFGRLAFASGDAAGNPGGKGAPEVSVTGRPEPTPAPAAVDGVRDASD